jgi:hypothetical protein
MDEPGDSLALGIHALNAPVAISDAAFIPKFTFGKDFLVIARGSLLQFGNIENSAFSMRMKYALFGSVASFHCTTRRILNRTSSPC